MKEEIESIVVEFAKNNYAFNLVVSKHIELATGVSVRKFITECKKVTDARMLNKITNKETRIR